jgi:hypothetical protein
MRFISEGSSTESVATPGRSDIRNVSTTRTTMVALAVAIDSIAPHRNADHTMAKGRNRKNGLSGPPLKNDAATGNAMSSK